MGVSDHIRNSFSNEIILTSFQTFPKTLHTRLWEIAIKVSLGKLALSKPFERLFPDQLHFNRIQILDITVNSLTKLTTLPFHHRDPFDRLIIAQALIEGFPIIGTDAIFDAYGVNREW